MNKRQRKKHDPARSRLRNQAKPPLGGRIVSGRAHYTRMLKNGIRHRQRKTIKAVPLWHALKRERFEWTVGQNHYVIPWGRRITPEEADAMRALPVDYDERAYRNYMFNTPPLIVNTPHGIIAAYQDTRGEAITCTFSAKDIRI